eukprot:Gb_29032 [translate_table: standard]
MKWELKSLETPKPLNESHPKSSCNFVSQTILLLSEGSCKLLSFMYPHILFTTSARDNSLSPVLRNLTRASERGRGERNPETFPFPPSLFSGFCRFAFGSDSSGPTFSFSSRKIWFDSTLFISNMSIESFLNTERNFSLHNIFRLFFGSCKLFSLM